MGSSIIQPSFTGGELAPALYGRVDLARYQTSVRTMRNFIAQVYGGATNRPGFRFINAVKDSSRKTRLIDFSFSTVQTYVIELGHLYMRFYKYGGVIEASPGVPVEIATPYIEDDLFDLKFTQSADVMTICHPSYAPRQLSRTSHTAWTLSSYSNQNGPFQDINTITTQTITANAVTGAVALTAGPGVTFTSSMVGTLIYLEDAHIEDVKPWASGQIGITVGEYRRSDGKVYQCTAVPTTLGTKGYRNGGNRPTHDEGEAWDGDTTIEASGAYAEGVKWKYLHSGFGVVKVTSFSSSTTLIGTVISRLPGSIQTLGTYKYAFGAWGGDQGYPSCVTYHQERQVFGGTPAQPQTYWTSKTGDYSNFGTSVPVADDDAITRSVPGRKVNAIRHLLPIDKLVVLTTGAEFVVRGGQDDVITPSTVSSKPQSFNGSSDLAPIVIGDVALYLQEKGSVVRDIGYKFESDSYTGSDLTTLSSHLFVGKQLVDWAFAQVPHSVVWCVRSDGTLLGLSYLRDQQVVGWHRHDTDGAFESVCVVSEGIEDVLYAVVRRTINGITKRYVERMNTRQITDVRDAFFVDCGLSYDGRNQAGMVFLYSGTTWDETNQITAIIAGTTISLSSSNVGDAIVLTDPVDSAIKYRLVIEEVTSTGGCKVRPNRTLPLALRGPNVKWDFAILDVGGLSHLEGKEVAILADGNVHPTRTVASGTVRLQTPAVVIHAGLPITADLETLDINVPGQETVRDKFKAIPSVSVVVQDTRGLLAGPDEDHLYELKQREFENYDQPVDMLTGLAYFPISTTWDQQGRVFLRQVDPLPATVLAVIPELTVGG